MPATGSIGHHGGVRGYRSLILFDPERRSGVVASVELVERRAPTASNMK